MPNRRQHQQVGMWAGAADAGFHARNESSGNAILEVIGGAIAGYYAAALPDILEPARNNPRHRSVCHSCVALLIVIFVAVEHRRAALRERANAAHEASDQAVEDIDRFGLSMVEAFYRLCAGAFAGAQAGYASHLLMDGNTPASLPLVCCGF